MSEVILKINGNPFKGTEAGNERSLLKSAIYVSNQAKVLAPADLGQLRNSIMYKLDDGGKGGFNNSPGDKATLELQETPSKDSAHVGTNLDYGTYQEYGTRTMNAQPYLRPAGETLNIKDLVPIMQDQMKKELKKGTKIIKFSNVKAGV